MEAISGYIDPLTKTQVQDFLELTGKGLGALQVLVPEMKRLQAAEIQYLELLRDRQDENYNLVLTNKRLVKERDALEKQLAEYKSKLDELEKIQQTLINPQLAPGYVYLVREKSEGHYKIGREKTAASRTKTFEVKLPFKIDVICRIPTDNRHRLEKELHEMFHLKRIRGTEWFVLDDKDVDFIKSMAENKD
jgi:hypothetical protein